MKARFQNGATIEELKQFEEEFTITEIDMKPPVKKEEIKVVYYKREDKKNNDSATGLF